MFKQNTICQYKHTRNLATNGSQVVRNGSHDGGNLAKSSTLHEFRFSIPNEPLKCFLSKQLNQTFLQLFNTTHKMMNFIERFFKNYLIIKHDGLINLTLNLMGEVNF